MQHAIFEYIQSDRHCIYTHKKNTHKLLLSIKADLEFQQENPNLICTSVNQ